MKKSSKRKDNSKKPADGFAITSFVFGVLSIIAVFSGLTGGFFVILTPIFSILGIVFWIIQRKTGKNNFATAGFVLSIISLILFLIFLLLLIFLIRISYQGV